MPFQIIRQDYSKIDCDAVVISTSFKPDAQMVEREGPDRRTTYDGKFQQYEARAQFGKIPAGDARITPAGSFGIKAPRIIYTVCPRQNDTNPKLTKADKVDYMKECYRSCLKIAVDEHLQSLAFVLIGAKNRGYDLKTCLTVAISEILHFLSDPMHPERTNMKIILTVFDPRELQVAAEVLTQKYIVPCIDLQMSNKAAEKLQHQEYSSIRREELRQKLRDNYEDAPQRREELPAFRQEIREYLMNKGMSEDNFRRILCSGEAEKNGMRGKGDVIFSSQTFSNMMDPMKNYIPGKRVVLACAMALKLTLIQTEELLASAGYAFIPSDKKDQEVMKYFANLDFSHLDAFKPENYSAHNTEQHRKKRHALQHAKTDSKFVKKAWKYQELSDYFHNLNKASVELTFSQIEDILGFDLPKSYQANKTMWYPRKNSRTMADAWDKNGYQLENINISKGCLKFQKMISE